MVRGTVRIIKTLVIYATVPLHHVNAGRIAILPLRIVEEDFHRINTVKVYVWSITNSTGCFAAAITGVW